MAMTMHLAVILFLAAGDPSEWSTFPPSQPPPTEQPKKSDATSKKKDAASKKKDAKADARSDAKSDAPEPPEAQSKPNEWSTFAPGKQVTPPSGQDVPPKALQRYRDAIALVSQGKYSDATVMLNELSGEYPKLAEIFAARCSAQLGLRQPAYAEADCNYALQLKPSLSNARFGLAEAEESLGKRDLAARHYREFINDPGARPELKVEAQKRADGVSRPPVAQAGQPVAPMRSSKPQCLVGKNGRQACGYNCLLGGDGVAACADMPEGDCTQNPDGHVTCAQIAERGGANAGGVPPECKSGNDGIKVCGYNCKAGTNGRMYCATRPEGQCTQNSDGTFTCS
jgi:hypothetical protein